tara:strand:+ start:95 stop:652 length:558 start_codon:yes stop_codon:yes gene_type:complete
MSDLKGTKTVGSSLSTQKQLIDKTNANLSKAKTIIAQLKSKNNEYKTTITNLQSQLKDSKTKLAKGNFQNAGEKTVEKGKAERLESTIKALKERAVQINNELKKYKEIEAKYEKQLTVIDNIIKTNNSAIFNVNKSLENMISSTSMKFNMRSKRRVVSGVKYPKRKTGRRRSTKRRMRKRRKTRS